MLLSTPIINGSGRQAVMGTQPHTGNTAEGASGEWRLASRMLVACRERAVKSARDHVTRVLSDSGLGWLLDDAQMVTSEIVTNAITHGSPVGLAVLLEIEISAGAARVSVLDYSERVPELHELPPEGAECGRGLHLIDGLAKSWGSRRCHADGFSKVVWAELS
jgi:anti-sigma regulatory factor (Ser/Thr protein kinase)